MLLPLAWFSWLLYFSSHGADVAAAEPAVKAAYYSYGSGLPASAIDATPLTHVFYAFAQMDPATYAVSPSADDPGTIATFAAVVRRSNPRAKTLLSIGGWGSNATAFSAMASSAASRSAFIRASISAARSYGFDGLDLDWEFPQSDTDMANLALLCAEWRAAVAAESPRQPLLLTAAVKYSVTILFDGAGTYPARAMGSHLDWVNIMSYDLHGSWETTQTAEHTALFDSTAQQILTVNYGVRQWLAAGLPPARGVLGLAAYGYTWYLANPSVNGVNAPSTNSGPEYLYDEIVLNAQQNNGTCKQDTVTKSAYCFWLMNSGQTIWVGFDDAITIAFKVSYIKGKALRGYNFWSLAGDRNSTLTRQAARALTSKY